MKLYKVDRPGHMGYDEYDSMIVAAKSEDEARKIHPSGRGFLAPLFEDWVRLRHTNTLTVTLIGTALKGTESGVILASFNAG